LTKSPKATALANIYLNYAYAILEAEARIALLTVGLDSELIVVRANPGECYELSSPEPSAPYLR
jgi:hypothetical protein